MTPSRRTLAATLLTVVTITSALPACGLSQARRKDRDAFFQRLMRGGARNGTVYVEIPLKKKLVAGVKPKDRGAVWNAFFRRVLREPPTFEASVPYWGDAVYQQMDARAVAQAVEVRVGDVLQVRTPGAEGSVKVDAYAIHHHGATGVDLLLAVAHPLGDFKVADTDILVAARRLPSCGRECVAREVVPDARTLDRIRTAAARDARIPPGRPIARMIALAGRFTRPVQQYVVYLDFGTDADTNPTGYWRTVILDADLSIIAVLGENDYEHIRPRSVVDVDGDGLDEVWVGLYGAEGRQAGLVYWRGGSGDRAFRVVATAYGGA